MSIRVLVIPETGNGKKRDGKRIGGVVTRGRRKAEENVLVRDSPWEDTSSVWPAAYKGTRAPFGAHSRWPDRRVSSRVVPGDLSSSGCMESMLIVDTDPSEARRLSGFFAAQGFSVEEAAGFGEALKSLARNVFDVVVSDVASEDLPLGNLLEAIRETNANPVIILMCDTAGRDTAIQALRVGATDFIEKPVNLAELEIKVDKGIELKRLAFEGQVLRGERKLIHNPKNFVGKSDAIQSVLSMIEKVSKATSGVILLGETGTGKELLAGAIHYNSQRAASPFVRVSCTTLPDTLFESELFGHERGAYTGAEKMRVGRFELANGGTVFLDEIGDMSLATQAKLLRVLQEHEFERLGSNRTIRVDVRVIAATNKDLMKEVDAGRFREDLYYRLAVVSIKVPPLRERAGDVELLAQFFLHKYSRDLGKNIVDIDPEALAALAAYHWPGNVRELKNVVERAIIMAEGSTIRREDLSIPTRARSAAAAEQADVISIPPGGLQWQEMERDLILKALSMSGWVQKEAARLLGLSTRVLNYKIKQFGITHPGWKQFK